MLSTQMSTVLPQVPSSNLGQFCIRQTQWQESFGCGVFRHPTCVSSLSHQEHNHFDDQRSRYWARHTHSTTQTLLFSSAQPRRLVNGTVVGRRNSSCQRPHCLCTHGHVLLYWEPLALGQIYTIVSLVAPQSWTERFELCGRMGHPLETCPVLSQLAYSRSRALVYRRMGSDIGSWTDIGDSTFYDGFEWWWWWWWWWW